jgi:hypothetical protein
VSLKTHKILEIMSTNQGIVYTTTGERSRGTISSYHRKPEPNFLNKTAHRVDISGLKSIDQRTAIKFDGCDYESKFTVGFEVEKNQLSRNAVKEYELFCGFETDSSCGYEAVTHVLPLLPSGQWRTKVYDMMYKAEKIISDEFSPSDKRCGGHITIGADGLNGRELNLLVRKNAGIILALFRMRLNNTYCGSNRRMEDRDQNEYNSTNGYFYGSSGWHHKYQIALVKGNCLEFRVPSKFESVKQMMRRYELMYELINFSVNSPKGTHEKFLKNITPIILSMYNGNVDKTNEILDYARHFQKFILKNEIHDDIKKFLR